MNIFYDGKYIVRNFSGTSLTSSIFLVLPIFMIIESSSVSFPENYYKVSGIPLHSSLLLFFIYFNYVKVKSRVLYSLAALAIITLLISTFVELNYGKFFLIMQSLIFFAFLIVFRSLSKEKIFQLSKYSVFTFKFFIIAHFMSMIIFSEGSFYSFREQTNYFFGLPIYQSLLTYNFVMIFILILDKEFVSRGKDLSYWIFLLLVILIELLMFRKVSVSVLLLYLLLYHTKLFLIFVSASPLIVPILFQRYSDLSFKLLDRVIDSAGRFLYLGANRSKTWNDSLHLLKDYQIFLFGNGENNYSHNYWLQNLTSHGILYSLILFIAVLITLKTFLSKDFIFRKSSILIFVTVLLDWTVNTNLYQPYYAAVLALVFVNIYLSLNERENYERMKIKIS